MYLEKPYMGKTIKKVSIPPFSFLPGYENVNTKKGEIIVVFPLALWPIWMLQGLLLPLFFVNIQLPSSTQPWISNQYNKNGILSFTSKPIFNMSL
jgi:hypothetical protein